MDPEPRPKRLLDQMRDALKTRHYSLRTETAYVDWVRRFILFHGKRHPQEMGKAEIESFLTHLAVDRKVAASTQNQALSAMSGVTQLMAKLLYGSGLRCLECARLRVKDVDFDQRLIVLRDGKGEKDRITMLPENVIPALREHLERVKQLHGKDLAEEHGAVDLPYALEIKYPNANREWSWQYIFPAKSLSTDPRTGAKRRHHRSESSLQKAVKSAARLAGISKLASPHTFRHSFATHPSASLRMYPSASLRTGLLGTATTSALFKSCSATRT